MYTFNWRDNKTPISVSFRVFSRGEGQNDDNRNEGGQTYLVHQLSFWYSVESFICSPEKKSILFLLRLIFLHSERYCKD